MPGGESGAVGKDRSAIAGGGRIVVKVGSSSLTTTAGGLDGNRLSALVDHTGARRLVVLGDFLHAAAGRVAALDDAFVAWRERYAGLDVTLVRGNHDANAGDPPPHWQVAVVAQPHPLPPFLACHHPRSPPTGHALCGHLHPGVRLDGRARESARVPCFVLGPRRTLLPAFGRFTGLALVVPGHDEAVVAIAGDRLFRLPSQG